jgi:hypothetical protein
MVRANYAKPGSGRLFADVDIGRSSTPRPDEQARKNPKEIFAQSVWDHGRCEISVLQKHIDEALRANSSHCAIAMAMADALPNARRISVDLQTIRWTDCKKGIRYCFLTPHIAQTDVIIPFDQGEREKCKPVTFSMNPAFVTRTGKKRTHTPLEPCGGKRWAAAGEAAKTGLHRPIAPASG